MLLQTSSWDYGWLSFECSLSFNWLSVPANDHLVHNLIDYQTIYNSQLFTSKWTVHSKWYINQGYLFRSLSADFYWSQWYYRNKYLQVANFACRIGGKETSSCKDVDRSLGAKQSYRKNIWSKQVENSACLSKNTASIQTSSICWLPQHLQKCIGRKYSIQWNFNVLWNTFSVLDGNSFSCILSNSLLFFCPLTHEFGKAVNLS